jgi:indole-3-glycerol phosphate synthase
VLRRTYDPVAIARAYERAGAAAISVLTEPGFFDGSLEHLAATASAVSLPLLRKDFVIDPYQIVEARAAGASAVLLIVAILAGGALGDLLDAADEAGLDALVEVHDEGELEAAIAAGATIVGVNHRNLRTLEVDLEVGRRLAPRLPGTIARVAESGITGPENLRALGALGYHAVLIGERLMSEADPGEALARLLAQAESNLAPGVAGGSPCA